MIHSSLYLPERIYEALRKIAFEERVKIHDLAMEGIDGVYGVGAYHLKAGRTGLVRPVLTMTEKTSPSAAGGAVRMASGISAISKNAFDEPK